MPPCWRFSKRSRLAVATLLTISLLKADADDFILAPALAGPTNTTNTILPFLIKETTAYTTNIPTMRYQQVYNSSLFTNASASSIYVTTLAFFSYEFGPPPLDWIVPSMQINLSTTPKTADNLSLVFAENVGADDAVVLRATNSYFAGGRDTILFSRPFRFAPPLGNLLLDVRIFDGSGPPFPPEDPFPQMQAYVPGTDELSRVWSTNVNATVASGGDTLGLETVIELTPIPSLQAQFFPVYSGTLTNIIVISWPSLPTNFVLQTSSKLGPSASWKPATNQVGGTIGPNQGGGRCIEFPAASAGAGAFYRLIWPAGTAETRTTTVPGTPAAANNRTTR
jgi:hypothetical protein